jgi:hypothetical protein
MNVGTAFHYSIQKFLTSRLFSKSLKWLNYNIKILYFVQMSVNVILCSDECKRQSQLTQSVSEQDS